MAMLEVRYGDDDGVDIFTIKQSAVIPRSGNIRAIGFKAGLLVRVVEVGRTHKHSIRHLTRGAKQITAANPRADGDEADLTPGIDRRRLSGEQSGLEDCGVDRCACCHSACAETHKIPARNRRRFHYSGSPGVACSAILALRPAVCPGMRFAAGTSGD